MARGTSFAFILLLAAAACVGDDPETRSGSSSGTTPGPDGGPGPSIGTNLAEQGGFENGCESNPLFGSNGQLSADPNGKSGKACKVCRTPGGEPSLYLYANLDLKPKTGEGYAVSILMRKAPGVEAGGPTQISVSGIVGGSVNDDGAVTTGPVAITDEWKEAKVEWTVAKDGAEQVRVDVGLPSAPDGNCFLVDELFVRRTK